MNSMCFQYIKVNQLFSEKRIKTISPTIKLQNEDIKVSGKTAVVSQEQELVSGYADLVDDKLTNCPFTVFGDHTEIIKYIDFPFIQGADGIKIIKADDVSIDSKYLYYSLKNCYYPTGFYQRHFKLFKKTYIPNLDITHQRKIATVLYNYDNLIEYNNKRIKALENIAEELYKEWFVRFRFPGYEKTKFENRIPLNWKYEKFSSIYSCYRGISYSSDEIECEEGMNLINLKNISAYGGFRRDGLKRYDGKYKTEHCVKYNDLVMGVTDMTQDRRTVGYVALIPKISGVISADLVKIISEIDNIFSYCLFRFGFYSKLFSQFGNGANVIHLKPSSIKNQKILIPNRELIDKFVYIAKPIFDEIEILNIKNEQLIKQRDSLLPRLMSGKLSVEGKEII